MGLTQSKEKQLFKQVRSGNVERIRALCQEGANLEWTDKEGNTPLSVACMNPRLYHVALTLIELGANINAHPPASRYMTPLCHAASRGLQNIVNLLLFNGAANYDSHAPLQLARLHGFTNIVRAIESRICVFSGWMRKFNCPFFLDYFAPQFRSKEVWVVVLPTSTNCPWLYRFELVVYASLEDASPEVVMALRNPNLEEPQGMHPNTYVTIFDNDNPKIKSLKLAPSIEEGRQQLKWFCDAYKGIPQPVRPHVGHKTVLPSAPPLPDDDAEDVDESSMHYTLLDSTPGDVPSVSVGGANTEDRSPRECVICMDAPSVAACVPCGHMAGCRACLTAIKSYGSGCPTCRAYIDQVITVYHV
ncbi:unnamed protein product [Eruca vesicaria subsp. sativa]|uniref:RING-type domain-containing protein n=1 Tax=Eruca vesicaria subsp. sativa TaxID=29727 RepID=A0ABC8K3V2_ERUVS|nr:unnamed protein product [Eruca vesicaria subsp. sativa]